MGQESDITINQIWQMLKQMQDSNKELSYKLEANNFKVTETKSELNTRFTESSSKLENKLTGTSSELKTDITQGLHENINMLETSVNNKLSKLAGEVKTTIDDFTKQVGINFCRQDEKLNKFKLEISEQLEAKVDDINNKVKELTGELTAKYIECKDQVLLNTDKIITVKDELRIVKDGVEKKFDTLETIVKENKTEVTAHYEKLKEIDENLERVRKEDNTRATRTTVFYQGHNEDRIRVILHQRLSRGGLAGGL